MMSVVMEGSVARLEMLLQLRPQRQEAKPLVPKRARSGKMR